VGAWWSPRPTGATSWLGLVSRREVVQNPEHLFEYSRHELCLAVEKAGARVKHVEGLTLPIPVWIPSFGWRDAGRLASSRFGIPTSVLGSLIRLGRHVPSLAENVAVVAVRST